MKQHWKRISGIVVKGHRVASGLNDKSPFPESTIRMQIPLFKERGLDLSGLYPATINISIHPRKFIMNNPKYTFKGVKWSPAFHPEDFSFSECRIIFNNKIVSGFIYYPHPHTKIGHFHDTSTMEIITKYIEWIRYGEFLEIEIDMNEVSIVDT